MPLYEYECQACHHRFEVIQKFSDPLVEICPVCGGVVRKLMSSPAIQFKGTGWYITDYAKKDGPSAVRTDATNAKTDASEKKEGSKEQAGASKDKEGGETKKSGAEKDTSSKTDAGATSGAASGDSTPKPAKTGE